MASKPPTGGPIASSLFGAGATDVPNPGLTQQALLNTQADAVKAGRITNAAPYQANAPQLKLPDFSSLPQIQSFVPKIQEAGRLKLESGLSALRQGYGKQSEELETQLGAAGTYDSGDKYKLQQRMFSDRASQESQLIYNIQAESLAQEVAELQRVGTISEERARMMMTMEFDKAVQEGNWQQAAAIHNADMNLQLKQYNQQSIELEAKLREQGYQSSLDWIKMEVEQAKVDIQKRGIDVEESKVDVARYETEIKACVSGYGQDNTSVAECIQNAKAEFEAATSGGGSDFGTAGGIQNATQSAPTIVDTATIIQDAMQTDQSNSMLTNQVYRDAKYPVGSTIEANGRVFQRIGPNAWQLVG